MALLRVGGINPGKRREELLSNYDGEEPYMPGGYETPYNGEEPYMPDGYDEPYDDEPYDDGPYDAPYDDGPYDDYGDGYDDGYAGGSRYDDDSLSAAHEVLSGRRTLSRDALYYQSPAASHPRADKPLAVVEGFAFYDC